ncbi:MAG: hypothetical protein ACREFZ_08890 [Acetobacteraceae bacterium]
MALDELGQPPAPCVENIHSAVYVAACRPDALDMGRWHCGTTHCRAGLIVTLAGEAGAKLARFHNTELAARLIYRASGYAIHPARFYDGNQAALDDMRKLAEGEAA